MSVVFWRKVDTGARDAFGAVIYVEDAVEVDGCLVAPISSTDEIESVRPDGAEVHYRVYLKQDVGDIRGADVDIDSVRYKVIGDPKAFSKTPNSWVMQVDVQRLEG